MTVASAASPGFLTIYPAGAALPLTSTLNFRAGPARANNAVVVLGTSASVSAFCSMESGTAEFILDVTGYFE